MLHQNNQSEDRHTCGARRQCSAKDSETESQPTTWQGASGIRQKIQALWCKQWWHLFHRWTSFPRVPCRNGWSQISPNVHTEAKCEWALRSLRRELERRPSFKKAMNACRQKFYRPNVAQLIRKWVASCEQCVKVSRIDNNKLTQLALRISHKGVTRPKHSLQTDLIPELLSSGSYENIVTAIDKFSRYLFAYSTTSQDDKRIATIIFNIMTIEKRNRCSSRNYHETCQDEKWADNWDT